MFNRSIIAGFLVLLCACTDSSEDAEAPGASGSGPYSAAELSEVVNYQREKHGLPAFGVLIQTGDAAPMIAVAGVRKLGDDTPVARSDMWLIGSTAKAMTATLLATYVRDETISFETTLYELFPEFADSFTEDAKQITVEHILSHVAGLKPNPGETLEDLQEMFGDIDDPTQQRLKILATAVSEELLFAPGSDFSYSNIGYLIAGAVIERIGGKDYETLLAERVFTPLGITDFGFGQPALNDGDEIHQPWGHRPTDDGLVPVAPGDARQVNPQAYNPAGNLHISLEAWAVFARDHVKGRSGEGVILGQAITEKLDMPKSGKNGYAMGWGVLVENGLPIMLTHNGSDGNWFADIRVYPYTDLILLMVTNDGREDGEAKEATKAFRRGFSKRYAPYPS